MKTTQQLKLDKSVNQYLEMREVYKENTALYQELEVGKSFEIGKTPHGFNVMGTRDGTLTITKIEYSYHYKVKRSLFGVNLNRLNLPEGLVRIVGGYKLRNFLSPLIKEVISPIATMEIHYAIHDVSEDGTTMYLVSMSSKSPENFVKLLPSYKAFETKLDQAKQKVQNSK